MIKKRFLFLIFVLLTSFFLKDLLSEENDILVSSNIVDSIYTIRDIDTLSIEDIFNNVLLNKSNSEDVKIDLDNFFEIIKKRSLDFKRFKLAEITLKQKGDDYSYFFVPTVNLSTTVPSFNNSSTYFQSNDSSYQVNSTSYNSTVSVIQNLPFNSTFSFSYLNGLSNSSNTSYDNLSKGLNFSITTPVFLGMSSFTEYNMVKRDYILASKRNNQNIIDFQYSSISKFINLYRVQSRFELDKKGYELSIKNYNEAIKKYKIGIMPEVDLLDLQLNMEKNKLSFLKTSFNLDYTVKNFNLFLGLSIESNTILKYAESSELLNIEVDNKELEEIVLSSNLELLAMKDTEINLKNSIDNIYRSNFINGSLNLFYSLNDSREYISSDFSSDFYFNFDNLDENKGFSFTLNFPIFNRNVFTNSLKRNEFELKLVEDEIKKKEFEIKLNLKNKQDDIEFNIKNYKISTQSNRLANKIYNISIKRFENGLLTSKDLIQNQISFLESKQQLINSRIDLELSIYELKRFIGGDLIYEW